MGAKNIVLRPLDSATANACVRRLHYSGKIVQNSQLHIGVYWQGQLEGALQFGPSLDKRKLLGLVRGTQWHEFIELNRMAFSETLPRNSESRALAMACRLLRKHAPQLKWFVTFADATQCGDGTIYRAAGFLLTAIKRNDQLFVGTDGKVFHGLSVRLRGDAIKTAGGASSMKPFLDAGARPLVGYQLRYVQFLDPTWRARLTVPVLPYAAIDEAGAKMYRGQSAENGTAATSRRGRCDSDLPAPVSEGDE